MYEENISIEARIARLKRGNYIVGANVEPGDRPRDIRQSDVEAVADHHLKDLELLKTWEFCPDCAPVMGGKYRDRRIGVRLEITDRNYSGTGVDIYNCPECGHGFAVSFRVAEVTRCTEWDVVIEPEPEPDVGAGI